MKLPMAVLASMLVAAMDMTRASDVDRIDDEISAAGAHNYVPDDGYVPDRETAIAVAVSILTPIYGRHTIEGQRPYLAKLAGGVWTVVGTLPENMLGGVFLIQVAKQDGRIIKVTHSR